MNRIFYTFLTPLVALLLLTPFVIKELDAQPSSAIYLAKGRSGYTYFQTLTGQDLDPDRARWDKVYQKKNKEYFYGKNPAGFLVENYTLIPQAGKVLDIAMGEGRNAVFLAKKGYHVTGVDFSPVAISKAKRLAREKKVGLLTINADLKKYQLGENLYDGVIVFNYLQRSLFSQIVKALKPNGVLIFESYTRDQLKYDKKMDAEFLLDKGELKKLVQALPGLEILKSSEQDNGHESLASVVARKK